MSGEKGVSAFPDGDNLFKWIGTINGPIGTVYEGLEFRLVLEFPNGYPITAPRVKFETACFHPNVDDNGNICLGSFCFFLLIFESSWFILTQNDEFLAINPTFFH